MGLLKFLVTKSEDLIDLNRINDLINNLVDVLASYLEGVEIFLPGTTDYDDFFYKLVQGSSILEQFSQTCTVPAPETCLVASSPVSDTCVCGNRFCKAALARNDDIIDCV